MTEEFNERCDACNAKAYVRISLYSGELFFCAHHFSKHEESLKEQSFDILDMRDELVNT